MASDTDSTGSVSDDDDIKKVAYSKGVESSGKFSPTITTKLESLYNRGMTGWGKKHDSDIKVALACTGLTILQLKGL